MPSLPQGSGCPGDIPQTRPQTTQLERCDPGIDEPRRCGRHDRQGALHLECCAEYIQSLLEDSKTIQMVKYVQFFTQSYAAVRNRFFGIKHFECPYLQHFRGVFSDSGMSFIPSSISSPPFNTSRLCETMLCFTVGRTGDIQSSEYCLVVSKEYASCRA